MEISYREFWTVLHGMIFGAIYLLAFGGALAGFYSLKPELITQIGVTERIHRMKIGLWTMSIIAWITVISGTWIVYIWYRAVPPDGADLVNFPRYFLLSKPSTRGWHTFGMEWKEHVAWIVPMLTTSIAFTVHHYGMKLANHQRLVKALFWLLLISFFGGGVAGVLGAFINKIAATR